MADLIVNGGKPLAGTITPSGNKNSVLPILCATLLTDEPVTLLNVPAITDVEKLVTFFHEQGSRITWDKAAGTMAIDHANFDPSRLEGELPTGMRSSVLLFAPLLQRMKKSPCRRMPPVAPSASASSIRTSRFWRNSAPKSRTAASLRCGSQNGSAARATGPTTCR